MTTKKSEPSERIRKLVDREGPEEGSFTERVAKQLEQMFHETPYLFFSFDFEGRVTSANRAVLQLFGYREDQVGTLQVRDLVSPTHLPLVQSKLAERSRGVQDTTPYELLAFRSDGAQIWLEISSMLIMEHGVPSGVQVVAREISAQKAAEALVLESERRFRETAELLPGIICEFDPSLRLTYVNRAGLELFGYTREEFEAGIDVMRLIAPEDRARAAKNLRSILQLQRHGQTIYQLAHRSGARFDMLINSAPIIREDKSIGIRSCLLDITELRQAERKLRDSEERFRRIFSESPLGIALVSELGLLLDANGSFDHMFGLSGSNRVSIDVFTLAEVGKEQRQLLKKNERVECRGWCSCRSDTTCEESDAVEQRFLEWYITPLGGESSEILVQVQDVTEQRRAEETRLRVAREETEKARVVIRDLREQITERSTFQNMVSRSKEMQSIFERLPPIAESEITVLVFGESGTGKELIARSLHELSTRRGKPFLALNCSALPDNLLENELFGHAKEAYTDAKTAKPGRFALAEGGTLFLDEIGDISPAMQVKLLRVLAQKTYEPLGSTHSLKANVRVVCATNKDLKEMVGQGSFRQDFYYRINAMNIKLPPLRERVGDIPLLCEHFIRKFNAQYHKDVREISPEALELLMAHDFPGNIRELENTLEHAFVFCRGPTLDVEHLPPELTGDRKTSEALSALATVGSFEDLERLYLQAVLTETGGNKLKAARRLGVHKTTIFRKLKKTGLGGG